MAIKIEIPAFYIDALTLDEGVTRPILMNRDPEPNETGVPVSTEIQIDITDVGDDSIDEAATQVFVNGSLALDAGIFQSGFDGLLSSSSSRDGGFTRRYIIDPTSDFTSLQVIPVRVVSEINGGAETIDETYFFTIEDLTAPIVVGASAKTLRTVRVSFDEAVDPVTAIVAGNYLIERQSAPAVETSVVSVEIITDSAVELTMAIDLTPGAQYKITVSNVEDSSGNAVASPNDSALFVAFTPAVPVDREFELIRMLAQINRDEDVTADLEKFFSVLQEVMNLLLADIDRFSDILDPDFAPDGFLDLMLLDFGNPFVFDFEEIDKRRLLRVLVAIYQQKGTAVGIINAIRFLLGLEVRIVAYLGEALTLGESELGEDWILGPSAQFNLYAFDVEVDEILTDQQRSRIRSIVTFMRPAHTHFVNLVEPTPPIVIDHLELGESELGLNWELH